MGEFVEEEKKKKAGKTSPVQPAAHTVQRDLEDVNGPQGGMLPDAVSAKIQSKRGSGRKLSDSQVEHFSEKFGRDMSDVHVHTDAESDTISRSLNARAFTIGSDIFLSKGINPEGSGRDAETMTHELTHVVQQNGHAGFGSLKLGAADTAQEHEAETTAQREYSPEMKEEDGTIQRGFLGALGSTIGHNLLGMVGLEDAYNATYGAKHKVQAAVAELDPGELDEFNANETKINNLQQQLQTIEYNLQNGAENDNGGNEALTEEYTSVSKDLAELREKQLKTVQTVDESITDADMIQYRNQNSGKSMLLGAVGGSILSGFSRGEDKEKARAQGMMAGANYGAGANVYKARKRDKKSADPDIKALQEEIAGLKQQIAELKGAGK